MSDSSDEWFFHNRSVSRSASKGEGNAAEGGGIEPQGGNPSGAFAFHKLLPGYNPTPLLQAPNLARLLGLGEVLLKVESSRFGLPAFKILGASWAVYRALGERLAAAPEPWHNVDELAERVASLRPLTLVAATDGNHGRAVAHMAALLDLQARIYVPEGTAQARITGIASEGADVVIVSGTYDDAVALSASQADDRSLVISDTSWEGYRNVPAWVTEGYATIFREIDDALATRGEEGPQLVAIQFGVGALAAAAVKHYRRREPRPKILSVEPISAACALASIRAGRIVTVPGPHRSIMAGLNCGRPSEIAWPDVEGGIDGFIAVSDERAREAMKALQHAGVTAGETGAAGLAGLLELLTGARHEQHRDELRITDKTRALLLITEGATDPEAYAQVIGLRN